MVKKTAQELAKDHKTISVSEFFAKNRHLLGFDNSKKALLTTIKEAVDNSLDACEESGILPEINVEIIEMNSERYRVIVEDNGPGIIKKQIPKIFAKLLYGSKFHKLSQSRGQQGIGISASVMYAQITTGKPAIIRSKTGPDQPAHYYKLGIDTQHNKPKIFEDKIIDWPKNHGTRIELDLESSYAKGKRSVDTYLKETAIANPHITITYTNPKAEQIIFARATDKLPKEPKEIKPHPYGVELGILMKMLRLTDKNTLQSFLTNDFSRVGTGTAKTICENASLLPNTKTKEMNRELTERLMKGIKKTKIISPPTDCISPIGEEPLKKGIRKEVNAEFYATHTRSPAVYRGNPFQVEVGVAYGGNQSADDRITILRFANRVPLLYQLGGCGITEAIKDTSWRNYGLKQSKGSLPQGPLTLVVHIASVWVPFTSESKEAIAHYPEILKEVKLAVQECGRKLGSYVRKKKNVNKELKKRKFIEKFIPHVMNALTDILDLKRLNKDKAEEMLESILEQDRGQLDEMKFDAKNNQDYDEEFANIGKEKDSNQDDEDLDGNENE